MPGSTPALSAHDQAVLERIPREWTPTWDAFHAQRGALPALRYSTFKSIAHRLLTLGLVDVKDIDGVSSIRRVPTAGASSSTASS